MVHDAHPDGIAIIGLAGRFPGARTISEFWRNLCEGVESIRFFSDQELTARGVSAAWLGDPHYVKATPEVDDVAEFDAGFFGYSPREARMMDPQQRIFLECAWEALEDAGYVPGGFPGSIGVFASSAVSTYLTYSHLFPNLAADFYATLVGNAPDFVSSRVSYKFNLRGPSLTIQTACSSSLVAVHVACQSLLSGECDMALAGGVSIRVSEQPGYFYQDGGTASPDGHCRAFDAGANGAVFGHGAGAVILKPVATALTEGDHIYAVIRGSAINNDGSSKIGFTAPSIEGQANVIAEALAMAAVEPETLSYIEAHGTGTALGDPIEVAALTRAFRASTNRTAFCALGTAKTNIGHLDGASGVTGLIKTALALHHRQLPPTLHFERPNPEIDLANSPFFVNTQLRDWPVGDTPRRAGVSSFGLGGTNAHVILEEAPAASSARSAAARSWQLLTLSAKNDRALHDLAGRYAQALNESRASFADIGYTTHVGRTQFEQRLAVVAETTDRAARALREVVAGQSPAGVFTGRVLERRPKIAFLFTGQGSQYVQMGRQLYDTSPVFRNALDGCADLLRPHLDRPLLSVLFPDLTGNDPAEAASLLDLAIYSQPITWALAYALSEVWKSWGIVPDFVLGHSAGEYSAACEAGVISLADGARLIAARGRLMQTLPDNGVMAAVSASEAQTAAAIAACQAAVTIAVTIAVINSPEDVVISGAREAVQQVLHHLDGDGIKTQLLAISYASHSPFVEPVLATFEQIASASTYHVPQIGFVSNVTGRLHSPAQPVTASYWRQHLRLPVQFSSGMQTLIEQGCEVFIELGPRATLLSLGRRIAPDGYGLWLPSLRKGVANRETLLSSLAELYVRGVEINWLAVDEATARQRCSLPTYPFQRQRYWLEQAERQALGQPMLMAQPRAVAQPPLLGRRLRSALPEIQFETEITRATFSLLAGHKVLGQVVFPAAGYLEMVLAAAHHVWGAQGVMLEDVLFQTALIVPEDGPCVLQCVLKPDDSGGAAFQVFSQSTEEEPWMLHVTGRVGVLAQGDAAQAEAARETPIDLQTFDRLTASAEPYYQWLRECGLEYGANFEGLEQIGGRAGEAWGWIRLPSVLAAESDVSAYQLHPVLLDACLQLFVASLWRAGAAPAVYLPAGLERLTFYRHPAGRLWGIARLHSDRRAVEGSFLGEAWLLTETGEPVAHIEGWAAKQAGRAELLRRQLDRVTDWLYTVNWQPAPLEVAAPAEAVRGQWLILADRTGVGDQLAADLRAQHMSVTLLPAGAGVDLSATFACIDQQTDSTLRGVVHLWSLDVARPDQLQDDMRRLNESALQVAQWLLQRTEASAPRLWIVTRGAQPVDETCAFSALPQSSLWGLGRTIALEHPEGWGGLIDLDPATTEVSHTAHVLKSILTSNAAETQLAWRSDQLYAARLTPWIDRRRSVESLEIHSAGTYLITGGLGDLGLLVANWLIAQGARHVALLGRHAPTDTAQQTIARWQQAGVHVQVYQADVSQVSELERVFTRIDEQGVPLRGLIHAAGVLDDASLLQQSWTHFARVFAAKVEGAWQLHRLTQQRVLDFFVLFSSEVSLLGMPGQANHAAANAFMDALAHYRRAQGLPAMSINWGTWTEIGAAVRSNVIDQVIQRGLGTITPMQGLVALEHLLASTAPQVAVLPVQWATYAQHWPIGFKPALYADVVRLTTVNAGASASAPAALDLQQQLRALTPAEQIDFLRAQVRALVARVLGLAVADMPGDQEPLMAMGLDSLLAIELRSKLQASLGVAKKLPVTLIFKYPTIEAISAYLADEALDLRTPDRLTAPPAIEATPATDLSEFNALSDAEAHQLLAAELQALQSEWLDEEHD